jgi:hypothetical protein
MRKTDEKWLIVKKRWEKYPELIGPDCDIDEEIYFKKKKVKIIKKT